MARRFSLRAYGNQFVRLRGSEGDLVVPPESGPEPWEIFTRTELGDDRITLEPASSTAENRRYVSAEGGGGGLVLARRAPAGDWETFVVVPAGGSKVHLRAHDGSYLCAVGRGGDLLLADRPVAGEWETFDLVELGGGRVAFRAAGGQYVRAELGGGGRVVVNRDNRDQEVVLLDDGVPFVSLRAPNGRYWCAQGGGYGGQPVVANRASVGGDWERFGLTTNADGTIALQAKEGRKYVQAENGGGKRVLANGDSIGIWEKFVRTPWYDRPRPRKLLVYHGFPSLINGANGNLVEAGRAFSYYEYVVLGRGLEEPAHDDHARTREVIANVRWNTAGVTRMFGSLALGASDVDRRVRLWKDLGVDGIVVDEFGFDRQSGSDAAKRNRQNDVVDRIHAQGLTVIANAWRPADVFDPTPGAVHLDATDFYFLDSHAIKNGGYQDPAEWRTRAERVREYQARHDFRVLSVTTAGSSPFDEAKFSYAWYAAMLYGHEAFGWGERAFSAGGPDANSAPFHERPSVTPTYFTNGVIISGTAHERRTDAGKVYFDPEAHRAGIR